MVKYVNGWEFLNVCNVYVKQFSGGRTKCMKVYMKPSLPENPDRFILHVSANDLKMKRSPKLIVKSIADLATTLKR